MYVQITFCVRKSLLVREVKNRNGFGLDMIIKDRNFFTPLRVVL